MNKSQISQMKATITTEYEIKINRLKEEMEDALSSLSRVEKTLGEEPSMKENTGESSPSRLKLLPRKRWIKVTAKTVEGRIMDTLQEMKGEFSRSELFEKANNDGSGKEMKIGSFAPKFAQLIKNGSIIVIREGKGSQGGLYAKADQSKAQS